MKKAENLKKRSSNFTHEEINLLQTLVTKYWNQLENKKSDSQTWKQKNASWEKLTIEFNSQNLAMEYRSTIVLRKKWENCKKLVKSKVSNKKKYVQGTGGGPSLSSTSFSASENQILSLINIQATGDEPLMDCDGVSDLEASKWIESVTNENSSQTMALYSNGMIIRQLC